MNLFCCLIVTSLFFLKKLFHDHNSSTLVNQLFLLFHEVNSLLIFSHLYLTYFSPFCHLVTSDAAVRSESYSVPGTKSFMTSKQLLIQEVSFLNDLTWVPCSIVQEGGLWLSTESALALLGKKPKTPTPNLRQAVYSFLIFSSLVVLLVSWETVEAAKNLSTHWFFISKSLVFLMAKNFEAENLLLFGCFPRFRARQINKKHASTRIAYKLTSLSFNDSLYIIHFFSLFFFFFF